MSNCSICQHAKRQSIDDALLSGRYLGVVARQFRLGMDVVAEHAEHLSQQSTEPYQATAGAETQAPVVLPACAEAILLGSQRLANCERFLVAIMDRLEQVLGNEAGLHELDMPDAEKQFQQAWQQMKEEPTRQQRMITWLNEQLQSDDMGL